MSFFHLEDPGIRNHMFKMLFYVNISGVRVCGCVYVELTAVRITLMWFYIIGALGVFVEL